MPSGRKNIYGEKSKELYKTGTVASERAAIANRDPARARRAMELLAREGTTNASGGRPATKMPKPQVIRTTVLMKPTPTKKK
jgi:hypothetical protein